MKKWPAPNRLLRTCERVGQPPLQPVASVSCGIARDPRAAPLVALSPTGGARISAHAEQDGGIAHGMRHAIRERKAARQKVFLAVN